MDSNANEITEQMKNDHPLDYILRMRKPKPQDLDSAFDMICAANYFNGKFGNNIEVEKNRECWAKIKQLISVSKHK